MAEAPLPSNPGPPNDPADFSPDYPVSGGAGWRRVPQSAAWPEWMEDEEFLAGREPWGLEDGDEEDSGNAPPPGMLKTKRRRFMANAPSESVIMARAPLRQPGRVRGRIPIAVSRALIETSRFRFAIVRSRGCPGIAPSFR